MIEKIRNAQGVVEELLKTDLRTRNNDKLLMLRIWHKQGFVLTEEQRTTFLDRAISSPESITRARRKLQEDGKYPAAKDVGDARAIAEAQVKAAMPTRRKKQTPDNQDKLL